MACLEGTRPLPRTQRKYVYSGAAQRAARPSVRTVPSTPMTPDEVDQYMAQHNLESLLANAVNEAVMARAEDPVTHIAHALLASKKSAPASTQYSVEWLDPHMHFWRTDTPENNNHILGDLGSCVRTHNQ